MEAGLNLFSLRDLAQTEEAFLSLAYRLKDAGYTYLQVSGLPLAPEAIARVSRQSGLPVYLTHAPLDKILNGTDALLKENETFGCKYIGLGYFQPELIADEAKCKETVQRLNERAEYLRERGFTLFLHNHDNEFVKRNGETVFDYTVKNAPALHFILDTYWVQYGGENVLNVLQKIKGRVECLHLKDYALRRVENGVGFKPRFAPVGEGTLDFPAIVKAAKQAGTEYFFVEQDDACDYPDPFGQVASSIRYLKNLQ